ncbi:MAG: sigma-54 dependent transcriptional regulator [Proteobacteria bacterium]|nr:sigma-54 dependent transcriptional regulator [Pseudomonadota bacterium]
MMNNIKILAVDDSRSTLEVIKRNLIANGFDVITALSVEEALSCLKSAEIDLVITDLKMPKISGIELIKHVRENYKDIEIMMVTGYPTIEGAVEAVKSGAEEYITKPFTDEELLTTVNRIVAKINNRKAINEKLLELSRDQYGLIGKSKQMQKIYKTISKAASTSATVLISGESGTGKEVLARAIHYASNRKASTFVPVNCASIPEPLLESELFGHMKGAFTGAIDSRAGFFQTAEGGTIFLDEIAEMSLSMQAKLLRVLQDKEIYMLGSSKPKKIDVKIVAATNKNLETLIKKDLFREDLYYRLNVILISLPPLRERTDDILLFVNYFSRKFATEARKKIPDFTDEVLKTFKTYTWPGNIRELENLIQRLLVITDGKKIELADLPSYMKHYNLSNSSFNTYNKTLNEVTNEYIEKVLNHVNGNKTKAAKILGVDRKTLRHKLDSNNE